MKYFLGTHEVSLLSGGQMALPAKIRKVLDDESLILSTGFDKCLFGFSPDAWEKIVQSGLDQPVFTADGRQIRRQLFSAADIIQFDSQGRITVPVSLRDYAQLKGETVVIGAGDHFEIWNKGKWETLQKEILDKPE